MMQSGGGENVPNAERIDPNAEPALAPSTDGGRHG